MESSTASAISPLLLLVINGLIALVMLFGAAWVRNIDASAAKEREERAKMVDRMAQTELALHSKFDGYVAKDEFREFRNEQRESFRRLFEVVDEIKDRMALKQDKTT